MSGVNKVILIGRLTSDPEQKQFDSGAVTNFSIAINESYTDKNGEKHEKTEFVRCNAWQKLGEICFKYLKKGSLVFVEGKLQTRSYDKDGVKMYTTEIKVDKVEFLSSDKHTDAVRVETEKHAEKPAPPQYEAPRPKVRNYAPGADNGF